MSEPIEGSTIPGSVDLQNLLKQPEQESPEKSNCYQNSQINKMKKIQQEKGIIFTTLISDFDNSYFRKDKPEETKKLEKITEKYSIPTIIVTGIGGQKLMEIIEKEGLRKPEIIVGAVGTEIFVLQQDGTYLKDEKFDDQLKKVKFDRLAIAKEALSLIENSEYQLNFQHPDIEKDFIEGKIPPDQPYKLSFYFMGDDNNRDKVEAIVRQKFPDLEVVVCEEVHHNSQIKPGEPKKYNIDLLPKLSETDYGGKAGAVNYLQKILEIKRGFRVGDSGNDERMLKDIAIGEGVIVGGATKELTDRIGKSATPIGETGFKRVGGGREGRRYFNDESGREGAGSIIEATIRRLQVTRRFEENPNLRRLIEDALYDLKQI